MLLVVVAVASVSSVVRSRFVDSMPLEAGTE